MSDEAQLLRFQIQGSAATPYRLTADGVGAMFRLFCSCPAGRRAGMMCKHAAALLMGEVGALVHPSDCLVELARRAHGSEVLARAFHHKPAAAKRPDRPLDAPLESGFAAAFASVIGQAEAAGWIVKASPVGIALHAKTPSGRTRSRPVFEFGITSNAIRPFYVTASGSVGRNFRSAEQAAAYFVEKIDVKL